MSQAVTILNCIREVLDSNLSRDTGYSDILFGFPQSLQGKARKRSLKLSQGRFSLHTPQFIIHSLSHHSIPHSFSY
jgi:hypothetical protein